MIDFHTFSQIRTLSERDRLTPVQIAASLGLNVKTVRRWLRTERYAPRHAPPRASGLDPYKPMVQRLLERHAYSAAQILRLVREQGYGGSYTIVKDYVRRVRPPARTAYLTLAFAPGECAQIDWGTAGLIQVGNTHRRLHFFVMVLCYSRLLYVWFRSRVRPYLRVSPTPTRLAASLQAQAYSAWRIRSAATSVFVLPSAVRV